MDTEFSSDDKPDVECPLDKNEDDVKTVPNSEMSIESSVKEDTAEESKPEEDIEENKPKEDSEENKFKEDGTDNKLEKRADDKHNDKDIVRLVKLHSFCSITFI